VPRLEEREKSKRSGRPRRLRSKYGLQIGVVPGKTYDPYTLNALFLRFSCKSKSPQTSRVQFLLPTELDWECAETAATLAGFRESNR
jgi:hypothetical protein